MRSDEDFMDKRVELYLAHGVETKGDAVGGANTPVTGMRMQGYGVKRLSACDGCLGDHRR